MTQLAEFVMLPNGTGYLVKSSMPTLASNETYQLWGHREGLAGVHRRHGCQARCR